MRLCSGGVRSSEDAIERSKDIYGRLGGTFNESSKKWRMPNGGRVAFAYLDRMADANEYQGRNVTDAWVEEADNIQNPDPSTVCSAFSVCSWRASPARPYRKPRRFGKHWIKSRYRLAPFPKRSIVLTRKLPTGARHNVAVIPSRIQDNRILLEADRDNRSAAHGRLGRVGPGMARGRLVGGRRRVLRLLEQQEHRCAVRGAGSLDQVPVGRLGLVLAVLDRLVGGGAG